MTPLNDGADLEAYRQSWPGFLERLAPQEGSLSNYLSQARPAAVHGGCLTLRFAPKAAFAMELCRKRKAEAERCWQTLFGGAVEFGFEIGAVEEKPPAAADKPQKPVSDRKQRAKVLDDPQVQLVLRELNATPVEVQEIEDELIEEETSELDTL